MLPENIDLIDFETHRRVRFLDLTKKTFVSIGFALYQASQFTAHPLAKTLFNPIERAYDNNASGAKTNVLPNVMLSAIHAQLSRYMPSKSADVCLLAIENVNLVIVHKLLILQGAIGNTLSDFQLTELTKVLTGYEAQYAPLVKKNPQGVLVAWCLNQLNTLALLVHLNLLSRFDAFEFLTYFKHHLNRQFGFHRAYAKPLAHSALYQWIFNRYEYEERTAAMPNEEPLNILAHGFALAGPTVPSQHPYIQNVNSIWLKACFDENKDLVAHVEQGGSAQRFLFQHYAIRREVFKHLLLQNDLPFTLLHTPLLLAVVLNLLPRCYWPSDLNGFEKLGYQLALFSTLPYELIAQVVIIKTKFPDISFTQLESLLLKNAHLVKLTYPDIAHSDIAVAQRCIAFYNQRKQIQLIDFVRDVAVAKHELEEPLCWLTDTSNSAEYGFTISHLTPALFGIFSRHWQNCLKQYQPWVALGLGRIFLLNCQKTDEQYLLEVYLNAAGDLGAIQIKDAANISAPISCWVMVRRWLATQKAYLDHTKINAEFVARCRTALLAAL